ncbi:MAG: ABC transporter ATP-binding protein [Butyrivibrio sp.]
MIRLNKINKSFGEGESEVHVLKNLSLEVKDGEFVAIMGKSGCGKTTLLNILGTLEQVDSGEYFLSEKNISVLHEKEKCKLRRTKVATIYQNYNLVEDLNVYDNIILPFIFDHGSYDKEYLMNLAKELDVDRLLYKKSGLLSGGEKQRVAIVRALLQKPDVILADEPTGNLDSVNSEIVIKALKKGSDDYNQTIVMVTHDKDIAEYADRIIHMKDGKII